jgi:hypothetical protein
MEAGAPAPGRKSRRGEHVDHLAIFGERGPVLEAVADDTEAAGKPCIVSAMPDTS